MKLSSKKFEELKTEAEVFYRAITKVKCPYFGEDINFNAKGLDHLKSKAWNKPRPKEDQAIRMRLLKFAPDIIRKTRTLQELKTDKRMEKINPHGKWQSRAVQVNYFAFISIEDDLRIKVVVKQIENGVKYFWSIIPYWKNDKAINKKVLHSGDLEKD